MKSGIPYGRRSSSFYGVVNLSEAQIVITKQSKNPYTHYEKDIQINTYASYGICSHPGR